MKVLVLGATGGTGRLIVRFCPGERPFRRGPGRVALDKVFVVIEGHPVGHASENLDHMSSLRDSDFCSIAYPALRCA